MKNKTSHIFLDLGERCPVSGLPVHHHPDWDHVSRENTYGQRFTLIGRRILLSEPWGKANLEDVQQVLAKMQQVMNQRLQPGETYAHISDLSRMTTTSPEIRKKYTQHFQSNPRLAGVLYFGASTFYTLSIKLGYKLNLIPFKVEIFDTYAQAIQRAMELLGMAAATAQPLVRQASAAYADAEARLAVGAPLVEWIIDAACTVQFDLPEAGVLRIRVIGVLEDHHIVPLFAHQETAYGRFDVKDGEYALVADITQLKGISLKARRLIFEKIHQWHLRHPLQIFIVQGATASIRAAILIARPFIPFEARIVSDFHHALQMIRQRRAKNVVSELEDVSVQIDSAGPENLKTTAYVDELLHFLGRISWDFEAVDSEMEIGPDHPFKPVYEVIGLVKNDFVELLDERNRFVQKLEERSAFVEAVTNSLPLGLMVGRMDNGEIVYANPHFSAVCGWEKQIIGTWKNFSEKALGRPDLLNPWVFSEDAPNKRSGQARREWADLDLTTASGESKHITLIVTPLAEQQLWIAIVMDVSERVRHAKETEMLQAQLTQAQKMEAVGTLAGGIAHDFNNILAAILGYVEMAMLELAPSDGVQQHLDNVLKASHRARELVKQILAFSRKDPGERVPVQSTQIAEEALQLIRATLPSTIAIQTDFAPDAGTILADPTQIHQILINLCSNAAHAMESEGGVLSIQVRNVSFPTVDTEGINEIQPGDYVQFKVQDSGHGIPAQIVSKIFDPYFTTKEPGKGTGMGLSVVHGIIRSHKGGIRLESAPDKGACFSVYFPRFKSAAQPQADTSPAPTQGTERILFVDDEVMIAEMTRKALGRLGYQVTTRTSSIEALEAFRAHPDSYDLVISDLTMPNLTGDRLAVRLLEIRKELPIILCTGFSSMMSQARIDACGIRALLNKPLSIRELSRTIRIVLDAPDQRGADDIGLNR